MKNSFTEGTRKHQLWKVLCIVSLHHNTPQADNEVKILVDQMLRNEIAEVIISFVYKLKQFVEETSNEESYKQATLDIQRRIQDKIQTILFND